MIVKLAAWGLKSGRSWLQLAAIPAGALLGALMVVPEANGQGSANLPELVIEAVRGGGLIQPPLPFDPGWRFILAVIAATLGAGTLTAAAGFGKPGGTLPFDFAPGWYRPKLNQSFPFDVPSAFSPPKGVPDAPSYSPA